MLLVELCHTSRLCAEEMSLIGGTDYVDTLIIPILSTRHFHNPNRSSQNQVESSIEDGLEGMEEL